MWQKKTASDIIANVYGVGVEEEEIKHNIFSRVRNTQQPQKHIASIIKSKYISK
jgi:hypothetical protein